jgi:hypothetical protein
MCPTVVVVEGGEMVMLAGGRGGAWVRAFRIRLGLYFCGGSGPIFLVIDPRA